MRIGLIGFGVVGKGLYDLVAERTDMEIVRVCCLEDVQLEDTEVTKNFRDILEDETIDTVVEAIGGLHPAYEFVRDSILAGKNIITPNKALVASFYDELLPLAQKQGVLVRCTAAVGGGIGWLSELERTRRTQKVEQVGGIMNGTCNYILDSMTRLGLGYAEALSQAEDVKNFSDHGYVCKLYATGKAANGSYQVYVQPTLFPAGAPDAAVPSNFNLITFYGSASGRMSLYGQGAGRYPTAHNVLQDCMDVKLGHGFYTSCGEKISVVNSDALCYYVRGGKDAWLESNQADTWGNAIITKPVSVQDMHAWLQAHPGTFIAALPTE